jgi:hypothetical protein
MDKRIIRIALEGKILFEKTQARWSHSMLSRAEVGGLVFLLGEIR